MIPLDDLDFPDELPAGPRPLDPAVHGRWQYAKAKIAEWTEVRDGARAEIDAALGEDGAVGTVDGEPVVRRSVRKVRRLNQKALKRDHADLVDLYTETNEETRLEEVTE